MTIEENLQGLGVIELSVKMHSMTDEEFDDWLTDMGLLHQYQVCDSCGQRMTPDAGGKMWHCSKSRCRRGKTIPKKGRFVGTFFEEARLSRKIVFFLSYMWAMRYATYDQIEFEAKSLGGASRPTVAHWFSRFRDVCRRHFQANSIQIGGPNVVVECDETFLTARHGRVGRPVRQHSHWLFGGVERGSNISFLFLVPDRRANTLLGLIQPHVRPFTTLMSDLWRSYRGITSLPPLYQHLTVNHGINFVDPTTGAHTQTIESKWGAFKEIQRELYGIHEEHLEEHITEFNWRERFGHRGKNNDAWVNLWKQIAEQFPCNR